MPKTLSILICAYNEEKNIGNLLDDILLQKLPNSWLLENIYIVSDCSTDRTEEIALNFQRKNNLFKLIVNKKRLGKALSYNLGKLRIESDYLVSLDADVKLSTDTFETLFNSIKSYQDLVAVRCFPQRKAKWNVASLGSMGSYYLISEMGRIYPLYSARGPLLVLSRRLYSEVTLPDAPGTDQFMYWSCRARNMNFFFSKQSVVYYFVPTRIRDYFKQNKRDVIARAFQKKYFGEDLIKRESPSPLNTLKILFKTLYHHPLYIISWLLLFTTSRAPLMSNRSTKTVSGKWGVAKSTK